MFAILIANTFVPIMDEGVNAYKGKKGAKSEKKKRWQYIFYFPIIFMIVVTAIFTFVLAFLNHIAER